MKSAIRTTCPYCGVGCGVLVSHGEAGFVVQGDPEHPANFGRLCSKGSALGETLGNEDRLLRPRIGPREVSWDEALERVAQGFREAIDRHGPDSVAFYVSGQLLTEDYYVANKLMKGFIGSGNIDTNSRLCMSSSVAAYKRALGTDTVPCSYEDLERADLILLVGSNTAWCHPVLFQRIKQARKERPGLRVVVIDPRRTPTCDLGDLHLALKPGTDVRLFNGLLNFLRTEDALDWDFLDNHAEGFAAALAQARADAPSIPATAAACEVPEADLAQFFRWFSATRKTVSLYSQGVNQWSCGTDKANAIINCHLATGRIGQPGMGPFSITGQPNAMGGREVGGLANQLAAHMDFEPDAIERVGRFWGAPDPARNAGLKAVDLFRAVESGQIKALWIMATNPVVSLPDADRVRRALGACELLVVSDMAAGTDTAKLADILLPAAGWGEKDGTVTNSERRISRQRAFLPWPGEARPDWWIVSQVARRMGYTDAFRYETPAEIFREHAALSAFENGGSRAFDLGGLAGISDGEFDGLQPLRWPVRAGEGAESVSLFGDGRFFTPSGKARLVPVAVRPPAIAVDERFPLVLNTGRIRDQWHTMTRSARAPRLNSHMPEPVLQIHPTDAGDWGLESGGLAWVASDWGDMLTRVAVTADQRRGSVFVPMHWSDQFARRARVGTLVNPALDPVSGQPEFKHTPVRVEPFLPAWHGFVLSRIPLELPPVDYYVRIRGDGYWRYELAGESMPDAWNLWARERLGAGGDWLDFEDGTAGRYRGACLEGGHLVGCLFVGPGPDLPGRSWLAGLITKASLDARDRASLLAGKPAQGQQDGGETVCACFNVGLRTILNAIRTQGLTSVEAIGRALQAGTNCGSCQPELAGILASEANAHVT